MAAAVLVSPSPHSAFNSMAAATRRQPLMSIPNATNSPHRTLTNSGSKRSRTAANVSQQENEPPTKRQALEKSAHEPVPITPRRQGIAGSVEGRVFERGNGELNTFQKRPVAARSNRERPAAPSRATRANTVNPKDVDSIRQWQRHYRKLFPSFRIYFDSVPEDLRARFVKQIQQLGAVSSNPLLFCVSQG